MAYEELIVLIPSHSLEDFPVDLGEQDASSLLNAFAIVWHPVLLARAGVLPTWHRADDPPEIFENRLIVVPTPSQDWIPSGWLERVQSEGATVIEGLSEREEMLRAALSPLNAVEEIDPDLANDFLALGTCYLQSELLTRHMHHFSNLDEVHLQREAIAAAQAALSQDAEAARTHLRAAFEVLTEARERFYPVDCYLIDLCLLIPRLADDHFRKILSDLKPVSFLISAEDLQEIAESNPEAISALREAWERETADVAGGEYRETPSPLLPLESVLWNLQQGRQIYRQLLGREPKTWGRRRFGLSTILPQILCKFGYHSALHILLDDGLYPDEEQSKVRWEGCDGSVLDALSRIPLAGDSSTSFLRFAQRMAESMEQDHVATVILARWPELRTPWIDDLRRMHNYAPALGRFVTLNEYFEYTDSPGRLSSFEAGEYFSPFLVQSVAYQENNPISRYIDHFQRRHRFDAARWYHALTAVLSGRTASDTDDHERERLIEQAGPGSDPEAIDSAEKTLKEFESTASRALADLILTGGGEETGYLVVNPLSFPRQVIVDLPELASPPDVDGPVRAVQFDEHRRAAVVDVPGAGFAWIAPGQGKHRDSSGKASLAEENLLRNEFFEVHINEATGGIGHIKGYGRSPKRLSQQLAFRFPRERVLQVGDGEDAESARTYYSEMRCRSSEVTCQGPALGEIVTTGDIVDQTNGSRLAGYRQIFRIWRSRPVVELDIELEIDKMPDGDPWTNYFACRFAWNDSTASLTRSVLQGAQGFRGERFESPHYLEIADEQHRTTIMNQGLPFHRKTGPRMVDSLLVVAGETRRRFHFAIAIDENYPMQAALDTMLKAAAVPAQGGPPRAGRSGWFFHVDARNVQITRILDLLAAPPKAGEAWERREFDRQPTGKGFAVRLLETEGRPRGVKLRCFRTPTSARQRDFLGRTITDLPIEGDSVLVEMTAYEVADIELRFDD